MDYTDMKKLKKVLDKFYLEYDFTERLGHDPVSIPHQYENPGDQEVAAFIAASLAYGRVDLFMPVIKSILAPAGRNPAEFFMGFSPKRDSKYYSGLSYRFNRERDILCFLYMIGRILKKEGSLRALFLSLYSDNDQDIKNALTGFIACFHAIDTSPVYGKNIMPAGLRQLLPSPEAGSACKRLNLYLRWMIRGKDIDFGIWNDIPSSKLIIPLDTHIAKISRCLGLTKRKAADWKAAKEITAALRVFDPDDPLKYDFALCHYGISGKCRGEKFIGLCSSCALSAAL